MSSAKSSAACAVAHGVAAVFDDDDLLVVALHVRQRLDEDLGLDVDVGKRLGHRDLSGRTGWPGRF